VGPTRQKLPHGYRGTISGSKITWTSGATAAPVAPAPPGGGGGGNTC